MFRTLGPEARLAAALVAISAAVAGATALLLAAENSMGFHAPQELARILGESIDLSRQAQVKAALLGAVASGAGPKK